MGHYHPNRAVVDTVVIGLVAFDVPVFVVISVGIAAVLVEVVALGVEVVEAVALVVVETVELVDSRSDLAMTVVDAGATFVDLKAGGIDADVEVVVDVVDKVVGCDVDVAVVIVVGNIASAATVTALAEAHLGNFWLQIQ